jgi:3-oxoacyl-[acyl-carrier protein] reductase
LRRAALAAVVLNMTGGTRTAVVTGSSRGIGAGIARELGGPDTRVVVNYRSSADAAAETVDAIEDEGGEAMAVQADVTDPAAVEAMRDRVHDAFAPVDIVVTNAGVNADTQFANMSPADWDRVIDVNLRGMFLSTQAFYEDLQEAGDGRLITISSVVGKQGSFGQANYAAAKSGMLGFTRTLALELAPHGTTANAVAPGYTETDMLDDVPDHVRASLREEIPLDRFASVEDIAAVVGFLASPEAGYITGEVIDVTGGVDL